MRKGVFLILATHLNLFLNQLSQLTTKIEEIPQVGANVAKGIMKAAGMREIRRIKKGILGRKSLCIKTYDLLPFSPTLDCPSSGWPHKIVELKIHTNNVFLMNEIVRFTSLF